MSITLNYFILLGEGAPATLHVTPDKHLTDIRARIFEWQKPLFGGGIAEAALKLYKPNNLKNEEDLTLEDVKNAMSTFSELRPSLKVQSAFGTELDQDLIHFVIAPPGAIRVNEFSRTRYFDIRSPKHRALTFKIERKVNEPNTKPSLDWSGVRCCVEGEFKQFIEDQVRKERKAPENDDGSTLHDFKYLRRLYDEQMGSGREICDALELPLRRNIINKLLCDEGSACPYTEEHREIRHHIRALELVKVYLYRDVKSPDFKTFVRSLLLEDFRTFWRFNVDGAACKTEEGFPFFLIALVTTRTTEGETTTTHSKYRPQPDFALWQHNFPRFLVEIDSSDNRHDCKRLHVQMSCAVRVARALGAEADKFYLMGAFISKERVIHRYFFYVNMNGDDDEEVCSHERQFNMNKAYDVTVFLFEFYNYARYVRSGDDRFGDKSKEIEELDRFVKSRNYGSLMSKPTSGKRPSPNSGQDDDGQGSSKSQRTGMTMTLEQLGYEADELQPFELPDNVRVATSSKWGRVAMKLIRKGSNELDLLQSLSSKKSRLNHVIPLLDRVLVTDQAASKTWAILPWATSVSISEDKCLRGKAVQLSRELVEGVAFLHEHKIAHLDIKPDNLVYGFESKRLYIIDFDLARMCTNEDEMVEVSCGTRGWSAPEVVLGDNKPPRAFNPIRADLWSCGKVLQWFAAVANEEDEDISQLVRLLMDNEPRRRPLLHRVVDDAEDFWISGRLRQALSSHVDVADTLQEAGMKVSLKRSCGNAGFENGGLTRKALREMLGNCLPPSFPLQSSRVSPPISSVSSSPSFSFGGDNMAGTNLIQRNATQAAV